MRNQGCLPQNRQTKSVLMAWLSALWVDSIVLKPKTLHKREGATYPETAQLL